MARDLCINLVLLITFILDLASSLYLSQESAIKHVGDSFIVICKDKERGLPVSWKGPKNNRLGQKTRPKVQTSSFGTAITFNNAREEDSGNYTCSTSGPIQEKNIYSLKVEDDLKFVDTAGIQYLTEGVRVDVLRCETNKRDATINWLYQNKSSVASAENSFNASSKYEVGGDGLIIRNISRYDAGIYLCEAIHGSSGGLKYKEITVVVQHKPSAVVMAQENIVYGLLNETVNLTCEVEAVPIPKFIWSVEDANMDLSQNIVNASSHKSILQVNVTEDYDSPIVYKCVARNKMGEEHIYFTVQLGVLPDEPTNVTLSEATSDSLTFDIGVPEPSEEVEKYHMEPTLFVVKYHEENSEGDWVEVEVGSLNSTSVLVNLTDLKKNTKYELQVATKNVVGLSDFVTILASTSRAARSVQVTLLIVFVSVCLSVLLPAEMRKA